jgi:ABC-type multidrug transport system fused ATPase/permease subunit
LLLDDPLSALDHQTAESIVEKLFSGPLLKDRIVILVTHRADLVKNIANQAIEVHDGQVTQTTIQQLDLKPMKYDTGNQSDELAEADPGNNSGTPDKFQEDEYRAEWGVQARVYWTYVKAGGLHWWAMDVTLLTLLRLSSFVYTWFLKAWGEAYGPSNILATVVLAQSQVGETFVAPFSFGFPSLEGFPPPEEDVRPWLWVFFTISMLQALLSLIMWMCDIMIIFTAAKHLFHSVMIRVTHATFRFYDVTPVGRLMNRMTSDISTVDGSISAHFARIALQTVTWISSVIIIASINPTFLLFSAGLMLIYFYIFSQFLPTSQSLRRLETVSLSPLFANFGELLQGLTTVRAFHAGEQFQRRIISVVDKFQGMDHFFWSLQSWVSFRFELLAALATFALTVLAIYMDMTPGLTAFTLSIANMFVNSTNLLCRKYGELQMEFVSVERIEELLHIDQEPQGTIDPPAAWPKFGADIVIENMSIRYAPHLDLALDSVNLTIPGGSTVALVGRTGSGKSTLAQALLGVVRPDTGDILIDNMSINEVSIDALRQRVTFVAQDPILFTGTIRHNLDPLEQFSDEDCSVVLNRICHRQGWTLSTTIEPGGRNISQGQRQLIGITRAVLRRSPIVILDEATASIDYETSMEIQQVLREEMQESTVITIAHRVEAVRDADYAIVLDHGKLIKHGPAVDMLST